MYEISGITSDYLQKQTLVLPTGKQIALTLYYMPQHLCWLIRELNYDNSSFVIKGLKIVNNFNLLNQYRNIIPFGLCCVTQENREPQFVEDFSQKKAYLYILSESEVDEYKEYLENVSQV